MTGQHRLPLAAFVLVAALCGTFVMNGWAPTPGPAPLAADRAGSATPSVLPQTHLTLAEGPRGPDAPALASASASATAEAADRAGEKAKKRKKGKKRGQQDPGSVLVRPEPEIDDEVEPSPDPSESPSAGEGSGEADPGSTEQTGDVPAGDEIEESISP